MGTYRHPVFGRWLILVMYGVFGTATVALVVWMTTSDEPPPAGFAVVWIGCIAWNAYWWLFRVACRITVRSDEIEWETPLQRGCVPSSALTAFGPMTFLKSVVAIDHTQGRSILVLPMKGIDGLATAVREARPDLDVQVGSMTAVREWMPGPSAWRPDT